MKNLEDIKKYVDRAHLPADVAQNYDISAYETLALLKESPDTVTAVWEAFLYGRAKGWNAHKKHGK